MCGGALLAQTQKQEAPKPPPSKDEAAGYVGASVCQACHEDIFNALAKSPHHQIDTIKRLGWEGKSCEACHGPGEKHAESADPKLILNPAKMSPVAADKQCLTCHRDEETHAGRLQSSHMRDGVPCTTCHKIHEDNGTKLVARTAAQINQQCSQCHATVAAQFRRPFHHKVPENAMSCVDCHNPHGSIRPAMTQTYDANEPGCLKCHGDKRGPFTFEHGPVRFEGCQACHEAHGSSNPRMLTRADVRFVCLECHANLPMQNTTRTIGVVPPAFHDLRSPVYQNCTVCHQKIHGSYVDANLLK